MEPIELEFPLDCSPEHAFDVWTCRATMWWPSAHTMSRDPSVVVTFEPRAGGRIFERTPDGVEHEWGEILAWEPPARLRYTWHIATEPDNATEVEITFAPEGDRTRVHVLHSGWDRLGAFGSEWRTTNHLGWHGVLPDYERACVATA
ncbi:MAG: SRPBCC domain-containing protein [Actinomycetota bacterium]